MDEGSGVMVEWDIVRKKKGKKQEKGWIMRIGLVGCDVVEKVKGLWWGGRGVEK
jgi:hypothetical protein